MNEIAVVKPDHLGDFVLSLPAMRALHERLGRFDLFAPPGNAFLHSHFLKEEAEFHPIRLAYLQKDGLGMAMAGLISQLEPYPLIVFLRDDGFCRTACEILGTRAILPNGDNTRHETRIQQLGVELLTGAYSRTTGFWPKNAPTWPDKLSRVGISLSAGFFANKIAQTCWMALAERLKTRRNVAVSLIGGPLEKLELQLMARLLKLGPSDVIIGGSDLKAFHDKLSDCDVVVGADSGTLHLISTARPVLGLFTSSPWQRFSPFGRHNRVLYSDIPCSPCIQFSRDAYNACLSRECAAVFTPEDIESALLASGADAVPKFSPLLHLVRGPSHIGS